MQRSLFLLLTVALAAFAADLSEECEYVDSKFILSNISNVKKCFNTFQVDNDLHVVDTFIYNLEIIERMYPYVEIASNPPSNPPGYFKAVNYTSAFEELKAELKRSDRVISKIFGPVQKFIHSFRDGHFYFTISDDSAAGGVFSTVVVKLPFEWEPVINNNKRQVFIKPNDFTDDFLPGWSKKLQEKFDAGVYASKVDEKDAFEFFANLLGEHNDMKSKQGSLVSSMMFTNNGFKLLDDPLDDAFDTHTITFSDGAQLVYNLGFLNKKYASPTRSNTWRMNNPKSDETAINESEIVNSIQNIHKLKREKRSEHIYVMCGQINNMNYVSIDTFSPAQGLTSVYVMELLECVESFDENDKPITVILPENGGGSAALRELVQFLLMPTSDSRTIRAARKTSTTRYLSVDNKLVSMTDFDKCEGMTNYEIAQFWKDTEYDDFGNGVVHSRTKKFVESFKNAFYPVAEYALKKHVRKPTEIIIATDGYCFSACSFFVNNIIRSGSAIVAGYGITMPGDEQFVASQCPSRVIDPSGYFDDLNVINTALGLKFHSTFLESYNYSEKMNEKIPGDYDILRIDKHCGYNKNLNPVYDDLLKQTTAVYEEFKTKCNPANKRLFLVSDECQSRDPNALYSGYVCGSNGEWDKKTCKISGCKPGYVVDFDRNKCVWNPCDPRVESASGTLHPIIGVFLASLVFAICSIL